jgi:hypothetical protein
MDFLPEQATSPNLSSLEKEYELVHEFLRYLLDYRAKIFNFSMVFNAALLTLILVHVPKSEVFARCILSILGFAASSIMLLAERRTIYVFYQYLTHAKDLEVKLGIGVLNYVRSGVESGRISLRRCFLALYVLLIAVWPFVVIWNFV